MDALLSTNHISFALVFLEGILSFFSPCVIPLLPVYMSYLAGNTNRSEEDGSILYDRKKIFLHTVFFVLGISFAFFLLGMSFTSLGRFFSGNKILFTRIGGILIILLGLFQLGILDFSFLQKERKLHLKLADRKMNPILAFLLGFTFSFAWTPCIGPALSSVLIMASGAKTSFTGNLLVLLYAAGFIIPFLLLGLFTAKVLSFLKKKQKLLRITIKAGGVILILIGLMTFTGFMNGISGYLNTQATPKTSSEDIDKASPTASAEDTDKNASSSGKASKTVLAIDFTLTDQYGNKHTLSDYKGKVVFLNFWATWCPPCNKELPDIEDLYQEYSQNQDEVVFIGVTNPKSDAYPNNQDEKKSDIISFLEEKKYTFPTVFDETGELLNSYSISAFPTTFIIDKKGNVLGYVPGMMTRDIMENVINQALAATE
jgi:Cytochrome c biogenesis protein